jgi:division protein CdvB (Snf7/Vps24/ESCRT-III family)
VAVAVGDVTVSFSVSGLPQPEAREIAQEMATVMEKRLKAGVPELSAVRN